MIRYARFRLPPDTLVATAADGALTGLYFDDAAALPAQLGRLAARIPAPRRCPNARARSREYFAGRRTAFDLPLAPEGTDFQQRVWKRDRAHSVRRDDHLCRARRARGRAGLRARGRRRHGPQPDLDHRSRAIAWSEATAASPDTRAGLRARRGCSSSRACCRARSLEARRPRAPRGARRHVGRVVSLHALRGAVLRPRAADRDARADRGVGARGVPRGDAAAPSAGRATGAATSSWASMGSRFPSC